MIDDKGSRFKEKFASIEGTGIHEKRVKRVCCSPVYNDPRVNNKKITKEMSIVPQPIQDAALREVFHADRAKEKNPIKGKNKAIEIAISILTFQEIELIKIDNLFTSECLYDDS